MSTTATIAELIKQAESLEIQRDSAKIELSEAENDATEAAAQALLSGASPRKPPDMSTQRHRIQALERAVEITRHRLRDAQDTEAKRRMAELEEEQIKLLEDRAAVLARAWAAVAAGLTVLTAHGLPHGNARNIDHRLDALVYALRSANAVADNYLAAIPLLNARFSDMGSHNRIQSPPDPRYSLEHGIDADSVANLISFIKGAQ